MFEEFYAEIYNKKINILIRSLASWGTGAFAQKGLHLVLLVGSQVAHDGLVVLLVDRPAPHHRQHLLHFQQHLLVLGRTLLLPQVADQLSEYLEYLDQSPSTFVAAVNQDFGFLCEHFAEVAHLLSVLLVVELEWQSQQPFVVQELQVKYFVVPLQNLTHDCHAVVLAMAVYFFRLLLLLWHAPRLLHDLNPRQNRVHRDNLIR